MSERDPDVAEIKQTLMDLRTTLSGISQKIDELQRLLTQLYVKLNPPRLGH